MGTKSPLDIILTLNAPATAQAGDNDLVVGRAPFAGTVKAVKYMPNGAMQGSATCRTLSVTNLKADATGTAVAATKAFTAGVDLAKDVANTITLTATAADLVVAAGDVLVWKSTHTDAGVVDPGGIVEITLTRSE